MLRSALSRASAAPRVHAVAFSTSLLAAAKAVVPGGKKKIRQGYGNKKALDTAKTKAKKGGMTHLKFRDAVRELGFEKAAAPAASGLAPLTPAALSGAVVRYSAQTLPQLKALNSFKKYQHHEVLGEPILLVSDNTANLHAQFVSRLLLTPSRENRVCLVGPKGVGKSTLLTQAQALALEGDVLVVHFDHPELMLNGTSDYVHNNQLLLYQQPMFTKRWIQKFREANAAVLRKLPLLQDIVYTNIKQKRDFTLKKGQHTVFDLVDQNRDFGKPIATMAFQKLIAELQHHSTTVPVLVTIDNATALINEPQSKYWHPDHTPIHVKEFEIGAWLLSLILGEASFAKGGILLAESSDNRHAHTLPVGLGLEVYDPYYRLSECDYDIANLMLQHGGVKPFEVANLTKAHARELLEFWGAAGVLQLRDYPRKVAYLADVEPAARDAVFDQFVQNSFVLTSGNVGGLVKVTNFLF